MHIFVLESEDGGLVAGILRVGRGVESNFVSVFSRVQNEKGRIGADSPWLWVATSSRREG